MAKFLGSAVVGDVRNKAGGVVFSKSKAGAILRRKVSPVQPRSSYQRNVRAGFTAISKLWGDASMDANREGWITLAGNTPQTDVFGNTIYLTGLQMFQRVNRALAAIGKPNLLVAPASLIAGAPGTVTVVAVKATPVITLTAASAPAATESSVVFAAAPVGRGRKFIGNKCRQIFFKSGAVLPTGAEVAAAYITKFGLWSVGAHLFVELFYVTEATGAQGGVSGADCIST
jgi:hypothetical protein